MDFREVWDTYSQFEYEDVAPDVVDIPQMREEPYLRPPMHEQTFVPQLF